MTATRRVRPPNFPEDAVVNEVRLSLPALWHWIDRSWSSQDLVDTVAARPSSDLGLIWADAAKMALTTRLFVEGFASRRSGPEAAVEVDL